MFRQMHFERNNILLEHWEIVFLVSARERNRFSLLINYFQTCRFSSKSIIKSCLQNFNLKTLQTTKSFLSIFENIIWTRFGLHCWKNQGHFCLLWKTNTITLLLFYSLQVRQTSPSESNVSIQSIQGYKVIYPSTDLPNFLIFQHQNKHFPNNSTFHWVKI